MRTKLRLRLRWDQWMKATAAAGILVLALAAPPLFADGKLSWAEAVMLAGFFLGGAGLYMKDHPPPR